MDERTYPLKNLAGRPMAEADGTAEHELRAAGIEVRRRAPGRGEVRASVHGVLGEFRFRRAWLYWVVEGRVPLEVADELHDHPLGRRDVRAGGHCDAAERLPLTAAHWISLDGREVLPARDADDGWEVVREFVPELDLDSLYVFSDEPQKVARPYVDVYHIDSLQGLQLFVNALRSHGLVAASLFPSGSMVNIIPSL